MEDIWEGETLGIAEIARFSPSACNTQPWFVKNNRNELAVFRYKAPGKRGIMPARAVKFYNRIDIGIFLCIMEICMAEKNIEAKRELFIDAEDKEYSEVARYLL